jgi:putative ABC transport system permease protein
LEQIRRMGSNVISVSPRASRNVAGRARTGALVTTLTERDMLSIRQQITAVVRASPVAIATLRLKAGDLSKETSVVGCEPDFFRIKDWPVEQGNLFDESDDRRAARVAVLGHTVARDLFGKEPPTGSRLTIGGSPFEILGTLAERGQGLDVANEDDQVYVPLRTAMRRLLNRDFYSGLRLEVDSWKQMDEASLNVATLLRERHRTRLVRGLDDFEVTSQKSLAETRLAASGRLGFLVNWIGGSALAVSGVGVLAIAWMAVRSRTIELGTRRALGAAAPDIFLQIFVETASVSVLGCLAGLAGGWAASWLVAARSGIPFVFDVANAVRSVMASALLNLSFALGPAVKASRMSPIRALRYE